MKQISKYWKLTDFCASHGRVVPHTNGGLVFSKFHCEDSRHDPSDTIVCSEGIGSCTASMVGILTMNGYVVEFVNEDDLLFCTSAELEKLKAKSEAANAQENGTKEKPIQSENPARPKGLKITRADLVIEYKAYEKCLEYTGKMQQAKALGCLTPPFIMGDYSCKSLMCVEDCIFCHCPFYDFKLFEQLRHNHINDYDEWVMDYFKDFSR